MRLKSQMMELLEKASKAYYEGSPIMSDEEFDETKVCRKYGTKLICECVV